MVQIAVIFQMNSTTPAMGQLGNGVFFFSENIIDARYGTRRLHLREIDAEIEL